MRGCQSCTVLSVVDGSHSPAPSGHIGSLAEDCLIAELESSEAGFSVTGTKVATEYLQGKAMARQLLRLSLSLHLGGHVVRGLVSPTDGPLRKPISTYSGVSWSPVLWPGLLRVTLHCLVGPAEESLKS